ncbi:thiamine-phosphate kinase [Opitutus sp. GAS368]|jgi:thiamine-monophosphate kinase|uniref:thiamine-phosphate kinase n=1 Tax=Opitutus sp. GAS368 TaxID=1882749 RepID=UPI00087BC345|nr:thiamine-phosphate kinase [Opitutus sp. GAS368]SDR65749.1 thiamine-monophosphate kinase [Opitutus sp. GAS368]
MNPFTNSRAQSVAARGERRLIAGIRSWLGRASPAAPFGIGDDCAVIPPTTHHQLVTTDPVIWGQHFDATVPARAAGAKLLKRNLSDIAAMGGRPVAAVVSLALAPQTSVRWLEAFYRGLAACARQYRVKIVGGDITQGPVGFFGAFLTLHGESTGRRIVTRRGARAGDSIYVTGALGGSLLGHHFKFTPRLAEGAWLAGRTEVRAMMDVSDGLAKDLAALTPAGLVPALAAAAIPVSPAARRRAKATKKSPLFHALGDGEDYELLLVVRANAPRFERDWRKRFPRLKLTRLGRFARKNQLPAGSLRLADYHGYEHLR